MTRLTAGGAAAALVLCAASLAGAGTDDLVFIHHSCGQQWLDNSLHAALLAKDYVDERNNVYYGTDVAPDPGRPDSLGSTPGDRTDMKHWVKWFNDYLGNLKLYGCADGVNRIVMFKSCYPASNISSDGSLPGDPFSGTKSLANYQAVFRHADGSGGTYTIGTDVYKPLEDLFAENPDTLFIPVTAPPRHYAPSDATNDAEGRRARRFNDWLKGDWLAGYNAAHPYVRNVAVFDWFDVLACADDDPAHPNRLTAAYGGTSGNSHPNSQARADSTVVFATAPDNFLDAAWQTFTTAGVATHWQAGAGDWLDAGCWDAGTPHDARDAHVASGTAAVTTGAAAARQLYVGPGPGAVMWTGGTLQAAGIHVEGSGLLLANPPGGWTLDGELDVDGGTVVAQAGLSLDAGATGRLAGGKLSAHVLYVGVGGSASMEHTAGDVADCHDLALGVAAGSAGSYLLAGSGRIALAGETEFIGHRGRGTFTQTGGSNSAPAVRIGAFAGSEGTYTISGGELHVGQLYVGGTDADAPGTLNVADPAACITVSEKLVFGPGGALTAVAGATIHMTGADLENRSTDPAALAGLANTTLIFEGGDAVDTFEVAGLDCGASQAAYADGLNFVVGTLQLGTDANAGRIRLVNAVANQPGGAAEALFVDHLVLAAGARIELNGLSLYYRNGGAVKQLFVGDTNLDGQVDPLDYLTVKAALAGDGACWASGDFDGDLDVDAADLLALEANFGRYTQPGVGPVTVPAPATLALLAAGALPALRRRRRRPAQN